MQRGRSISGEIEATFSALNLVENVLVGQTVESRVRRIEEILLLRADVRRAFDALNDADPATMKAISDWLTGVLLNYRRTDVPIEFADFPTLTDLPRTGAAIYTIWDYAGALVYVGVSGRSATSTTGPWGRLRSHWGGRRSGDQFWVYVADHYFLPDLTRDQFEAIAAPEEADVKILIDCTA